MMPRRAHSRPPRHERASPGGGYEALPGVRCHWRALDEIAAGGGRALARIAGVVDAARRVAWAQVEARHGALPAWAGADEVLDGVTCLRLDATMVACRSEKQGAGSNFKGFALLPLGCWCAHELEAGPDDEFPVEFLPQLRAGQAGRATTTARARAVCGSTSSEHAHTISFGGRLHQATLRTASRS